MKLAIDDKQTTSPLYSVIDYKYTHIIVIGASFVNNKVDKNINHHIKENLSTHQFGSINGRLLSHVVSDDKIVLHLKKEYPELIVNIIRSSLFKKSTVISSLKGLIYLHFNIMCLDYFGLNESLYKQDISHNFMKKLVIITATQLSGILLSLSRRILQNNKKVLLVDSYSIRCLTVDNLKRDCHPLHFTSQHHEIQKTLDTYDFNGMLLTIGLGNLKKTGL